MSTANNDRVCEMRTVVVAAVAYALRALKRCRVLLSDRLSVPGAARAAAAKPWTCAHRWPHMTRGPRKFWSDC